MNFTITVGDRSIDNQAIFPLLTRYQLLLPLLREVLVDEAIAPVTLTPQEAEEAQKRFYEQYKLTSPEAQQAWAKQQGLSLDDLKGMALRPRKLEKFKQETFGKNLEADFLKQKNRFDQVVYSLIRTQDVGMAQELYFRLQDDPAAFGVLAQEHSQGPEAKTGGLVGPVELGIPHPVLAKILASSQPGQLSPPINLEGWFVILRLEQYIPAKLDEAMAQRLLNESLNQWIQEELQKVQIALNSSTNP